MIRPFQSIRWRVQIWHGLILFVAIAAFCVTAYQLARQNMSRRLDREIRETERSLVLKLSNIAQSDLNNATSGETPNLPDPSALLSLLESRPDTTFTEEIEPFVGAGAGSYYFVFADKEGTVLIRSKNAPDELESIPAVEGEDFGQAFRLQGNYRQSLHRFPQDLSSIVGRNIQSERQEIHRFGLTLAGAGFAFWSLGLVGGWWLTGKAISPIKTISDTATRITEGNLQERIQISHTSSELGQLSEVLNESFDRLEKLLEQQRRFTADASHELRTPLTIILSETQRMQRKDKARSPEENLAAFELCYNAASRMQALVESLLLLAREDIHHEDAILEALELKPIVESVLGLLQLQAKNKGIILQISGDTPQVRVGKQSLEILLSNLIGNAVQHHPGNGSVKVNLSTNAEGNAQLQVIDDGNGISPEDLPHIFDRFYRADQSRQNTNEAHSGLGLAIVKSIIRKLNATIQVESEPTRGTTFTVTIPIS